MIESSRKHKRFGEIHRLRKLAESPPRAVESPNRPFEKITELSRSLNPNKDLNLTPPRAHTPDESSFEREDSSYARSPIIELQPSKSPIGEMTERSFDEIREYGVKFGNEKFRVREVAATDFGLKLNANI